MSESETNKEHLFFKKPTSVSSKAIEIEKLGTALATLHDSILLQVEQLGTLPSHNKSSQRQKSSSASEADPPRLLELLESQSEELENWANYMTEVRKANR